MIEKRGFSRRDILAASAGAIGAGTIILSGREIIKSVLNPAMVKSSPVPVGSWPYPAEGLNIDLVKKYAKEGYYQAGCGFAGAYGLVQALKDMLGQGTVWDNLAIEMFKYGFGGALGWGTLCGALNSSLAIITLACPEWNKAGSELIGWYTVTPLPTEGWEPPVQTVSKSPLCHLSIGAWTEATGKTIDSQEKVERCSCLAADTAVKAAQLLNEYAADGNIVPSFEVPEEYASCLKCHALLKNEVGKMNCVPCHTNCKGS